MPLKILVLIIALVIGLLPPSANADTPVHTSFYDAVAGPAPISPTSLINKQALLIFWRSDCPPCRKELPAILTTAHNHPALEVVFISLQRGVPIRSFLPASLPGNIHVWATESDETSVLSEYGESRPALPYAVALHNDGSLCEKHQGMLGTQVMDEWAQSC